ncbi:TKL protein kinase [Aphanomyces invadans]|uniref:TKL protein kinase n=1 Tax=Aphanomyces invadans TaxID=157072 RepID=A0A024TW72_9STRA|nr:TKL protein kinase [Aphanomyces invadans]ETV97607.1 TKL protein kinase [Aphanomyces invadans]|eukprot:XP_008873816.1 TKL protein kinase [Aphanomyces invadans]
MAIRLRQLDGGSNFALNIALVSVIGVIAVVILVLYCRSRRPRPTGGRRKGDVPPNYMDADRTINLPLHHRPAPSLAMPRGESDIYIMRSSDGGTEYEPQSRSKQNAFLPFRLDPALLRAKVDYADIHYTRKLSKGAFGEVWLGQCQGNYVAIKQILEERKNDAKEIECFVAEIKLMAIFHHPNIVDFRGFSWNPTDGNMCALTEYMKHGDLFVYLQRNKASLAWKHEKVGIAIDIAQALVYLHSLNPKVIHRDLKSKNVLLDDNFTAKLSDFGISRLRQLEETMTAGVGTALWAAPEVFLAKKYNDRADVYSLGVVLSELDTCAIPYADQAVGKNGKLDGMAVVKLVTQQQAKPSFSPSCPEEVRALAYRCLDYEPDNRPSAAEVVEILKNHVRPALDRPSF